MNELSTFTSKFIYKANAGRKELMKEGIAKNLEVVDFAKDIAVFVPIRICKNKKDDRSLRDDFT